MGAARRYGFIGGGVMAEAILRALLDAGMAAPGDILVAEPLPQRREALAGLGVLAASDTSSLAAHADVLFLAVKPGVVPQALSGLGPALTPRHLLITIAAGVPLARIEALVPEGVPVVRAMPNVLISVRDGATALCGGTHATQDHVRAARELFEAGGLVVELPETMMDAVTGLSGSGPGYVMLIVEALADGGVQAGLPRDAALLLAAQTVHGAARLLLERTEHPGVWKDRVATPSGTTIAGLAELETAGVRGALMRAVMAATRRAAELSEKN